MNCKRLIFGDHIPKAFFQDLLKEKDNKYLTELKRNFNFLKKYHPDYKKIKLSERLSKDFPFDDIVEIMNDVIQIDTHEIFTLYHNKSEINDEGEIYFSFKIDEKVKILDMVKLINKWKKNKDVRSSYYNYLTIFGVKKKEPTIMVVD